MVWYAVVFYVLLGTPGTYIVPQEFESAGMCRIVLEDAVYSLDDFFKQKREEYPESFVSGVCISKEFNNLSDG